MLRSGWAHAPQLLSLCSGARKPQLLSPRDAVLKPTRLEPVLRNGRGHCGEEHAHRGGEWPPLAATVEDPRTAPKTQRSQK